MHASASATPRPPSETSCAEERSPSVARSHEEVDEGADGRGGRGRGQGPSSRPRTVREVLAAPQLVARLAEEGDDVVLGGEGVRHRARDVLEEAHHPDGRRREDRLAVRLVVERDVSRDDGRLERAAGEGEPLHRRGELAQDLGPLGVAEVEAVGDGERPRARAGDVQGRLGHGVRGAAHRVGEAVARVDVGRQREPLRRPLHAEDGRVSRRPDDGVRPHAPVVLAPDPGLAAEVRRGEEDEEGRPLVGRAGEVDRPLDRRERLGERPGTAVDGRVVDERRDGEVGRDLAVPVEDHARLARHLADLGDVEAPLLEDLDDLALAPLLRDEEHPLLRLGEHQLVGRHPGLAHRDLGRGRGACRRRRARTSRTRTT